MALTRDFYEKIYEKENIWIGNLNQNLLNVFYLPELKTFYSAKYNELLSEYQLTGNEMIMAYIVAINNMISKIDFLNTQDREGNVVDLNQLKDLFIVNLLTNNINSNVKLNKINEEKNNLYKLRNKVIKSSMEDYIDDDFYYEEEQKKVA